MQKAIAGHTSIVASVVGLSRLEPQASIYQDPHSRL